MSSQCGLSIGSDVSFNYNTNAIGLKEFHQAFVDTYIRSIIQQIKKHFCCMNESKAEIQEK